MRQSYKYIITIAVLGIFLILMLTKNTQSEVTRYSKKTVSLSTFTLYDIAEHISEGTIELVKIIPSGVDIHSYEPTPNVMAKIEKSDLLIYSGAGLEPWLESFDFKSREIAIADFIKLKHVTVDDNKEHEHHGGCNHSTFDPHFWFDVENMKRAVDIITYEFIRLEPSFKLLYIKNRDEYIRMLEILDLRYQKSLKSCKLDTIITNHDAFSYLSQKYAFNVSALKGLSPDSESSPKDMIRIINEIENYKAPVVFFEDFSSSKSMEGLAKEANVEIDSLHTLGNITKDDMINKYTYQDIMIQNLEKISKALVCQ